MVKSSHNLRVKMHVTYKTGHENILSSTKIRQERLVKLG